MISTSDTWPGGIRRIPFVVECAALWLAMFVDAWTWTHLPYETHLLDRTIDAVTMAVSLASAVVALTRRRFDRLAWSTGLVALGSLLITVTVVQTRAAVGRELGFASVGEVVALALLIGATCRRLAPRQVIPLALFGGCAMILDPLLRFGVGSSWALLAVPVAVVWGGSIGVGLVLRDADNVRTAALAASREDERLSLAREMHDFVAHHITGIIVLAQGAQVNTARSQPALGEIEQAGTEALTAMRRLVGMLRTETFATLRDALDDVRRDDDQVEISLPADLEVRPQVITTAHRIALEAVTNARRHGRPGTTIALDVRCEDDQVVLEVINEVAGGKVRAGSGYGLTGMAERARAVGGTVEAGPQSPGRWRVTATLPLAYVRSWT